MYRIVMAVGLTGGHIYPAKVLAEDLGKENYRTLFVARSKSALAKKILEDEGYPVLPVDVEGFPRDLKGLFFRGPIFFFKQMRALFLLRRVMVDWKPHLVIGFGSYVSFPAILAAFLTRKRALLFEPNAKMGLANKVLKAFAGGVISTFDLKLKDSVIVAPPLRKSLLEASQLKKEDCLDFFGLKRDAPCVLVFGGSQGARVLNQAFGGALSALGGEGAAFTPPPPGRTTSNALLDAHPGCGGVSFLHVTGEKDYQETKTFYESKGLLGSQGACLPYLEEMGKAYQAADVVISRAGALTALELVHFKKPCVLVPLGAATESHQRANARYLESLGLAVVIEESDSLKEDLLKFLREFSRGDGKFKVNHVKLESSVKKTFKEIVESKLKEHA